MKQAAYIVLGILILFSQSCSHNEPRITEDTLIGATYNPAKKMFLLTYANGDTEGLDAVLNSAVSPTTAEVTLKNGSRVYVADASEEGEILFNGKGSYNSSSYDQSTGTFQVSYSSGFTESLMAEVVTDLTNKTAIRHLSDGSILVYSFLNPSDKSTTLISRKGKVTSASYNVNNDNAFFTLRYSSGYKESVPAHIDAGKSPASAKATLRNGMEVFVKNSTVSGEATLINSQPISPVNSWIYDNMHVYYLWSHKLTESPNYSLNPEEFFYSILHTYHETTNPEGDRFSWIEDNYLELQESLSGVVSGEIGFEYIFVKKDEAGTQYYALVLYPKLGTDAEKKGIKRGRWITKVDGQDITPSNYRSLFSGTGSKTLSVADMTLDGATNKYQLTDPVEITVQMHEKYAETPVYYDQVFSIGDKKIGYLVYHFFARDNGDDSNSYDEQLMKRLSDMQSQGVTEMVLDLRYNGGGAVSSAIALSSALVKNRSSRNLMITSQYNAIIHNELSKKYGANYNKEYFINRVQESNIVIPSLNLSRLYVLTGEWTASASELVINSLKPYMEVITIGETTYGKNVGSITLFEEDDPNNKWGLQPIIVKYFNNNGESDYSTGFKPDHEVDEFANLYLYPYGDRNDPLLGKAISLITGSTRSLPTSTISTPFRSSQIEKRATARMFKPHRFDMQDDVWGDEIKELMNQ